MAKAWGKVTLGKSTVKKTKVNLANSYSSTASKVKGRSAVTASGAKKNIKDPRPGA